MSVCAVGLSECASSVGTSPKAAMTCTPSDMSCERRKAVRGNYHGRALYSAAMPSESSRGSVPSELAGVDVCRGAVGMCFIGRNFPESGNDLHAL